MYHFSRQLELNSTAVTMLKKKVMEPLKNNVSFPWGFKKLGWTNCNILIFLYVKQLIS